MATPKRPSTRSDGSSIDINKKPGSQIVKSPPILGAFNWSSRIKQLEHEEQGAAPGKENYNSIANARRPKKLKKDWDANRDDISRIMVYVRLRPMSTKEQESGAHCSVRVDGNAVFLTEFAQDTDYLKLKRLKGRHFTFDAAFPETATQQEVYEASTAKLVEAVLQGQNSSIFCYGATGAGKTYTMLGSVENPGVMLLALNDVFIKLGERYAKDDYVVNLSYLEVYNELVRDLLTPGRNLTLREDAKQGIFVSGLTHHQAHSAEDVMLLLQKGNQNRQTEATKMNETSSRSHAILQVTVECQQGCVKHSGKLSLIDLAGSERAGATDRTNLRSLEGSNINKSLLALSSCINALVEGKQHIPFRNSRLTQLLKDSLGGVCHTAMIANVSPSSLTFGETQNSLHWADRAKEIRTKICTYGEKLQVPDPNEQAQKLLQMQKENEDLKLQLADFKKQQERLQVPLSTRLMQQILLEDDAATEEIVSELQRTLEFLGGPKVTPSISPTISINIQQTVQPAFKVPKRKRSTRSNDSSGKQAVDKKRKAVDEVSCNTTVDSGTKNKKQKLFQFKNPETKTTVLKVGAVMMLGLVTWLVSRCGPGKERINLGQTPVGRIHLWSYKF